ncbi:hypothetical protein [Nonlabens agnitus]|uniref:RiboL-PSP-HEPN domain-containing protein n=1 Tax=Nonlabens agnitus TaxID=870484 RepID=A0A2S9WT60_9FLAO|nr:hypothetical protein [Nonlabens agnitus]PRP66677.1 hypothetical protein BST86_05950 [Nonlabens agnitus]
MVNDFEKIFSFFSEYQLLIQDFLLDKSQEIDFPVVNTKISNKNVSSIISKIEESQKYGIIFSNILQSSLLISVFSFYEVELMKICDTHASRTNSNFSVKDLKGHSDFEKIKMFLTKQCKLIITNPAYQWDFINSLKTVRNCLVHNNGKCLKTSKTYRVILQLHNKNEEYFDSFGLHPETYGDKTEFIIDPQLYLISDLIDACKSSLIKISEDIYSR